MDNDIRPVETLPAKPKTWWPIQRPPIVRQNWWFYTGKGLTYWTEYDGERTWLREEPSYRSQISADPSVRLASFHLVVKPSNSGKPLLLVLTAGATYQLFEAMEQYEEPIGAVLETRRKPAHSKGEILVKPNGWRKPRYPELLEEAREQLIATIMHYFRKPQETEPDIKTLTPGVSED